MIVDICSVDELIKLVTEKEQQNQFLYEGINNEIKEEELRKLLNLAQAITIKYGPSVLPIIKKTKLTIDFPIYFNKDVAHEDAPHIIFEMYKDKNFCFSLSESIQIYDKATEQNRPHRTLFSSHHVEWDKEGNILPTIESEYRNKYSVSRHGEHLLLAIKDIFIDKVQEKLEMELREYLSGLESTRKSYSVILNHQKGMEECQEYLQECF